MFFLKLFCKKRHFWVGTAVSALLAVVPAGCASAPEEPAAPEPSPEEVRVMERAGELAEVLRPFPVRGLALELPEKLDAAAADRIVRTALRSGFNRLIPTVTRISAFTDGGDTALTELLEAAARGGISVEPVLRQCDFTHKCRGAGLFRGMLTPRPDLPAAARAARKYFDGLDEGVAPCSVGIALTPHFFTAANPDRPPEELYAWSEQCYGVGLDNDQLLLRAMAELSAAREALAPMPVRAGIADFYHEKAVEGKLSKGTVADFFELAPMLLLYDTGNKPSEAMAAVENELAAGSGTGTMLVAVRLAPHTAIESGSLRRRDWADFMRAVTFALGRWREYPAFGGPVLGPMHLIERLQAEEE